MFFVVLVWVVGIEASVTVRHYVYGILEIAISSDSSILSFFAQYCLVFDSEAMHRRPVKAKRDKKATRHDLKSTTTIV